MIKYLDEDLCDKHWEAEAAKEKKLVKELRCGCKMNVEDDV